MAYDEDLANRTRAVLAAREGFREQKMFGGIAFMLKGNMACGVLGDGLLVRLGPDGADAALDEAHTRVFDMTGRPMRGFVHVESAGIEDDAGLRAWVERGAKFAESLPPK